MAAIGSFGILYFTIHHISLSEPEATTDVY